MKKLSKLLLVALAVAGLALPMATSAVYADDSDPCCKGNVPPEVKQSMGCDLTGEQAGEAFSNTIINIINAVLSVIGIVAVIFIIYGGFLYLTSAGDAAKVKKGKETLLYACIGLAIVGLSFAIVNFVILKLINQ